MIIFMSDILCVTDRTLCGENFLCHIEKIAKAQPKGIILREKDLSADDYKLLADDVMNICKKYGMRCILHNFADIAIELKADAVHVPLHILKGMGNAEKSQFSILGASCHSVEDAVKAESLGCTYITAGHIFDTECKKGAPGRGLEFLKNICGRVSIPVYAIGGINKTNYADVRGAGARGACLMSGIMRCDDVMGYLEEFKYEV